MSWPHLVASALGQSVGTFFGTWSSGGQQVICRFEGSGVNEQLLDILREQLRRCGPANLTSVACPQTTCPPVPPEDHCYRWIALLPVVFAFGVAVGWFVSWCSQSPPGRAEPRLPETPVQPVQSKVLQAIAGPEGATGIAPQTGSPSLRRGQRV